MKSLLFVLALVGIASICNASVIGPNCGTCQGNTYDLSYSIVSSIGGTTTLDVFLTMDTTGYTGTGLYVNAVAPKVSTTVNSATLLSAPTSYPSGSTWTTIVGTLSANACSDTGATFVCSQSTGLGAPISDQILTWEWQINVNDGTLLTDPGAASLKELTVDANGVKSGDLLSEAITASPRATPEPATLTMLSSGLLLLGISSIKRRRS
jgi:hypothetical protein